MSDVYNDTYCWFLDNWLMIRRLIFFNVTNKLYPVHLIEIVLNTLQLIKRSTDLYSRGPIFFD